jgi:hypothetical protein
MANPPPEENTEAPAGLPEAKRPPLWRQILPWAFAVAFFGLILARTDVRSVLGLMRQLDLPTYIAFTAVTVMGNLLCDTLATSRVYQRLGVPVTFRALTPVRAAAYLPSLVNYHVGQAFLTYLLARKYRAPLLLVVGGTLIVYATTIGALVALVLPSLPYAGGELPWVVRAVVALLLGGCCYLVVLWFKPGLLASRATLEPLFRVGVRGHLTLLAWRFPHALLLFAQLWAAYRFFGIRVPLAASFAYLPLIMLVSALPITPQGAGTRDLVALQLLAPFTPAGADHAAPIVAAGAAYVLFGTLAQAVLSLAFTPWAGRILREGRDSP